MYTANKRLININSQKTIFDNNNYNIYIFCSTISKVIKICCVAMKNLSSITQGKYSKSNFRIFSKQY